MNLIYVLICLSIGLYLLSKTRFTRKIYLKIHSDFWCAAIGLGTIVYCHNNKEKNKIKKYLDRKGYVAIVTGGGRGMGPYIVRELCKCDMHVIVGVRNFNCEELEKVMKEENVTGSYELMELDVSKMKSIKAFTDTVKSKYPKIDLLVNNAGIINVDYKLTEDNFESLIATNYFGPFMLTHLLLENLKLAAKTRNIYSRIVNIGSCAHYCSNNINFDDLNLTKEYVYNHVYGQSKTALLMMTRYINKTFEIKGEPIRAYNVHPGIVITQMIEKFTVYPVIWNIIKKYFKTALEGAISVVFACIDEGLEGKGGQYLSNCVTGWSSMYSKNEDHQRRLHKLTCEMLKIKQFGVSEM